MNITKLDHSEPLEADRICRTLLTSYAVEARLIGVTDFAPLRRTATEIRDARSVFYGCSHENRLAAVTEIELDGEDPPNIASFAVHPRFFRRGIGSELLQHIVALLGSGRITVSTALRNAPAISLYEKHGFRNTRRWTTPDGIDMVTMEFSA